MEETIDNVGAVPREVSCRCWLLLGKGSRRVSYAHGRGPVRRGRSRPGHGRVVPPAPRGRIPSHLSPRDGMRRKLTDQAGSAALRFADANCGAGIRPEHVKQGRGFRQFLLRGLEKVNGEWSLICTGHNLLKLFRFGVNLHRKARVDGSAQRIRIFCRGSEHDAHSQSYLGAKCRCATGKISCRDPLSLTCKHR